MSEKCAVCGRTVEHEEAGADIRLYLGPGDKLAELWMPLCPRHLERFHDWLRSGRSWSHAAKRLRSRTHRRRRCRPAWGGAGPPGAVLRPTCAAGPAGLDQPRTTMLGYWSHLLTDAGAHTREPARAGGRRPRLRRVPLRRPPGADPRCFLATPWRTTHTSRGRCGSREQDRVRARGEGRRPLPGHVRRLDPIEGPPARRPHPPEARLDMPVCRRQPIRLFTARSCSASARRCGTRAPLASAVGRPACWPHACTCRSWCGSLHLRRRPSAAVWRRVESTK